MGCLIDSKGRNSASFIKELESAAMKLLASTLTKSYILVFAFREISLISL